MNAGDPVRAVPIPIASAIGRSYASTDLADAFAVALTEGASTDPEVLARFIFAQQPVWISGLMKLRDALVAPFGLKTGRSLARQSGRVGLFRIYAKTANEIILGEDDSHLNFRVSVLRAVAEGAAPAASTLTLSTVVSCNNGLGRFYITVISPFHRIVVRALLARAARVGWPRAS